MCLLSASHQSLAVPFNTEVREASISESVSGLSAKYSSQNSTKEIGSFFICTKLWEFNPYRREIWTIWHISLRSWVLWWSCSVHDLFEFFWHGWGEQRKRNRGRQGMRIWLKLRVDLCISPLQTIHHRLSQITCTQLKYIFDSLTLPFNLVVQFFFQQQTLVHKFSVNNTDSLFGCRLELYLPEMLCSWSMNFRNCFIRRRMWNIKRNVGIIIFVRVET